MKQERLLKIILSPHLSEKAAIARENGNQYVFQVAKDATKPEIKEAVGLLFGVVVDMVRIVNVKSKPKRFGSIQGKSKPWKKAYVKLAAGQKIEYANA